MKLSKLIKETINVKKVDDTIIIETNLGKIQIHEYEHEGLGRGVEIYINGWGQNIKLNDLERETPTRGSIRLIQIHDKREI